MKRISFLILIFFTFSCSHISETQESDDVNQFTISPHALSNDAIFPDKSVKTLFGSLLSNVKVSRSSFNPGLDEEIAISYSLSESATVSAKIFDPDWGLIRSFHSNNSTGNHTFIWDGKDLDNNLVPDEAYFFTITAKDKSGKTEIYDPTTFSGGLERDITIANVDPQNHSIHYKMPEMGRVMIRIGIQNGPLMNTLVDWKPRVKGAITEYWNGKDNANVVDIYNHPDFKMVIAYFTLPENSVITYGNKSLTYKEYKQSNVTQRPLKEKRDTTISRPSPHYRLSRLIDYSPHLAISFVNVKAKDSNDIPILSEKALVKVDLTEADKRIFQNQQFEICFFLDYKFYAEDEAGYIPFNWVWDLTDVKEGEHLLTVNLSTFKDQIGVFSQKIRVEKN